MITADKEKYSWKTPTAVSLFFTLLCLPGLITPIHGDEAVTYLEHIVSTPFQLLFQYSGPNQHTLFSILSNSLMRIIGEYEIIFRLPVFAAAILSIFVIYHLGQQSLQIKKNMQEDALVYSPSTKHISSQDISFILYGYAGKYQQKSKAGLLVKGDQQAFPLNHLFGVYQENKDDLAWKSIHPFFFFRHLKHEEHFKWQIIFMLLPLNAGLTEIQESLFLREEISYFDGFQGYLLTPIVEGN